MYLEISMSIMKLDYLYSTNLWATRSLKMFVLQMCHYDDEVIAKDSCQRSTLCRPEAFNSAHAHAMQLQFALHGFNPHSNHAICFQCDNCVVIFEKPTSCRSYSNDLSLLIIDNAIAGDAVAG